MPPTRSTPTRGPSTSRSSSPRSTTSRTRRPASTTSTGRSSPSRRTRPASGSRRRARSRPSASPSKKADHTLLRIDFGSRLPAGSSRGMLLTFDITDPGGVPTRTTRIGPSLVAFGAWAYASEATAGSTVTVVFPAGYTIDARSDLLGKPTTNDAGRTVYKTARLAKPLTFFAYFVADRPSAFTETTRSVVGRRPGARRSRSAPGPTTRPGPNGPRASSSRACRSWPRRSACRGSPIGPSSCRRRSARPGRPTPVATTPMTRRSRSRTTPTRS